MVNADPTVVSVRMSSDSSFNLSKKALTWMSPVFGFGIFAKHLAVLTIILAVATLPAMGQLSPDLADGLQMHRENKLKDAVESYTEAIKKGKSPEAFNWRGMAYDDLGQLDKALADFNEAIALSPNYADAYNNRGEVYRKQKKLDQAMADYRKASDLDRNFAEARYNMGLIFETQKKIDLATKEFNTYLLLKPDATDKQQVVQKIESLKGTPGAAPPSAQAAKPAVGEPPKPAPQPQTAKPAGEAPKPAGEAPKPPPTAQAQAPKQAAPDRPGPRPGMPGGAVKPEPPKQPADPLSAIMNSKDPTDAALKVASQVLIPMLAFIGVFILIFWVLSSLPYFIIANKTGTGGAWMAFVPVLDELLKVRIAQKPTWMFILLALGDYVPIMLITILLATILSMIDVSLLFLLIFILPALILVSWVIYILVLMGVANARQKPAFWGLLVCLAPVVLGILASGLQFLDPSLFDATISMSLNGFGFLLSAGALYYLAFSK